MNDLILYVILALMGIAITYVIIQVRQPVEIREERRRKQEDSILDDLGEIGDILKELQPEIESGLKLKEEQKKSLSNWINTIDKVTKSRILKWAAKRLMK